LSSVTVRETGTDSRTIDFTSPESGGGLDQGNSSEGDSTSSPSRINTKKGHWGRELFKKKKKRSSRSCAGKVSKIPVREKKRKRAVASNIRRGAILQRVGENYVGKGKASEGERNRKSGRWQPETPRAVEWKRKVTRKPESNEKEGQVTKRGGNGYRDQSRSA